MQLFTSRTVVVFQYDPRGPQAVSVEQNNGLASHSPHSTNHSENPTDALGHNTNSVMLHGLLEYCRIHSELFSADQHTVYSLPHGPHLPQGSALAVIVAEQTPKQLTSWRAADQNVSAVTLAPALRS